MTNYYTKLSEEQRKNIAEIDKSLTKYGITNKYLRAGILAVVSKESTFLPRNETSYKNTSASRIKQVFGSRVAGYSDAQLDIIKKDDRKFFNLVYGGEWGRKHLGNTQPDDGYNYRGRGFNGLTGRGNYAKYKDLGILENPDSLNKISVSAKVLADYFKRGLTNNRTRIMEVYGLEDPMKVKDLTTATKIAWGLNAGSITKNPTTDVTGGYQMAIARVEDLFSAVGKTVSQAGGLLPLVLVLGGTAYYIFKVKSLG